MKFVLVPFLAAVFAASQVLASPLRIEILSSQPLGAEIKEFKLGHALANEGANTPAVAQWIQPSTESSEETKGHRNGCAMRKLRMQTIHVSNWIRQQFGLPLIEMPRKHQHGHLHFMPLDPVGLMGTPAGIPEVANSNETEEGHPAHHHHGHMRPKTFMGRLQKALMTLGVWEGRIIAFVIGCGIGSLLRMIFVLFVVFFRSRRAEPEATPIYVCIEEVNETDPPRYQDEKVEVVTDVKVSA